MKIREVLRLRSRHLPGTAQSITADNTPTIVAPAQMPNRLVGPPQEPGSDIFFDAEASNGKSDDIPPALDRSPTSFPMVPTPHTRDLDFIKAQIARLPPHTEQ